MDMKQRGLEREASEQRAITPLVPPVDIIENGDGITVRADMPGVAREDLSIGVDGDTLTLEATVSLGESASVQPVYAEVRVAQYKRSFVLSRDLDTEKINASIRNGVLTLQVPKREQAKPRRIEIKAD
jgi:HSP20 family protein